MTSCISTTTTGKPCPNAAGESGYCWTHDPLKASERAAARRRGGLRRHPAKTGRAVPEAIKSPADVLLLLDAACADTLAQENGAARTRGLVALALAYLKAFEVGSMADRITALEERMNTDDNQITIDQA